MDAALRLFNELWMKVNIPHLETLLDARQPNKDKAFAKKSIAPLPKNLSTQNIITTSQSPVSIGKAEDSMAIFCADKSVDVYTLQRRKPNTSLRLIACGRGQAMLLCAAEKCVTRPQKQIRSKFLPKTFMDSKKFLCSFSECYENNYASCRKKFLLY
jgi:hypothetical protein